MNRGTKEKTQNTLISSQWEAPWSHYSPWLPLELPAPTPRPHFCPTWLIFLIRRKILLFSSFGLFSLHHFGFVQFVSESFFPQGGPELLINLRPKMPNSVFRQVSHSRWVCWGYDLCASRYLNMDFHGELLERAGKVVTKHTVWRQLRITIMDKKLPHHPTKGLAPITVLRGGRGKWVKWIYSCWGTDVNKSCRLL